MAGRCGGEERWFFRGGAVGGNGKRIDRLVDGRARARYVVHRTVMPQSALAVAGEAVDGGAVLSVVE